ncbi:MAG: PEGA domain-containing protein [Archangium sp.]|nr:PEGA domain-containing protein [Archangium sp.]
MTDPKDDDELQKGPVLGADGTLEQRLARVEQPLPPAEERLELAERAPQVVEERIETFRDEAPPPAPRRGALKVVVALVALGAIALAALLVFKPKFESAPDMGVRASSLLNEALSGDAAPIIISSTPTGATVFIDGKEIGQTPWSGDNRWVGEPALVLQLPGYRPWEGKLKGGEPQTLDIKLKK